MADGSLSSCERVETPASVTCAIGAANVKGAWSQVVAASAFQYESLNIDLMLDIASGGGEVFLVDVGIGASGSEVVVVPNILFDCNRSGLAAGAHIHLSLPIQIRAGSRIAVRCQDIGGAGTRLVRVMLTGRAGGANVQRGVCGKMTTYGAISSGNTNGTLVDQGATANTYGAWTQITAATSAAHNFLQAVAGNDQQTSGNSTGGGTMQVEFQIAVGASGSEQIIAQGLFASSYSMGSVAGACQFRPFIPEGSRLSMRTKCSVAAAADRHVTFVLIAG
jgi:alkylhydroperoxidase/carboxymuconolactone decarboxylase family protein YurZ